MSRHLSVLENAELVTSRCQGQKVLYELNPDNLVNTLTGLRSRSARPPVR
ncbi:MAG TPA: hypothetical protein VI653_11850 [Steroidobacteraceae bacterium]